MNEHAQPCAKCKQPTVTVHTLSLDSGRRVWILCCLCVTQMVNDFDAAAVAS